MDIRSWRRLAGAASLALVARVGAGCAPADPAACEQVEQTECAADEPAVGEVVSGPAFTASADALGVVNGDDAPPIVERYLSLGTGAAVPGDERARARITTVSLELDLEYARADTLAVELELQSIYPEVGGHAVVLRGASPYAAGTATRLRQTLTSSAFAGRTFMRLSDAFSLWRLRVGASNGAVERHCGTAGSSVSGAVGVYQSGILRSRGEYFAASASQSWLECRRFYAPLMLHRARLVVRYELDSPAPREWSDHDRSRRPFFTDTYFSVRFEPGTPAAAERLRYGLSLDYLAVRANDWAQSMGGVQAYLQHCAPGVACGGRAGTRVVLPLERQRPAVHHAFDGHALAGEWRVGVECSRPGTASCEALAGRELGEFTGFRVTFNPAR